jgi:hypothetical protein
MLTEQELVEERNEVKILEMEVEALRLKKRRDDLKEEKALLELQLAKVTGASKILFY